MIEFVGWAVAGSIALIALTVLLTLLALIRHLRRAPRCPHCNDWLEIASDWGEVLYNCPGCGRGVWEHEVEVFDGNR